MIEKAFSAPGKALLAGGYLVLFPEYSSYVVALSARIHVVVSEDINKDVEGTIITVKSPQFVNGEWIYKLSDDSLVPELVSQYGQNPFVEKVIKVLVGYSFAKKSENIKKNVLITIYSDDEYHSQVFRNEDGVGGDSNGVNDNDDSTSQYLFHYHSKPIKDIPKTGLGSSAALTTALTGGLFSFYSPHLNPLDSINLDIIHNLAQLAHCSAQGKVGSGFDIASAVYGSLKYSRFPRETISEELFSLINHPKEASSVVKGVIEDKTLWKMIHIPCSLPSGLCLLMGDVIDGSETPSMVKKVLSWKEDKPNLANEIWQSINEANINLVSTLAELGQLSNNNPQQYQELLKDGVHNITTKGNLLNQLRENFLEIRKYLRKMTVEAGVPIEPESQTKLLDKCNEIPGVIGGVVPGAGGMDAISILALEDSLKDIKGYTKGNKDEVFSTLTWLDLREERVGLREEDVGGYR